MTLTNKKGTGTLFMLFEVVIALASIYAFYQIIFGVTEAAVFDQVSVAKEIALMMTAIYSLPDTYIELPINMSLYDVTITNDEVRVLKKDSKTETKITYAGTDKIFKYSFQYKEKLYFVKSGGNVFISDYPNSHLVLTKNVLKLDTKDIEYKKNVKIFISPDLIGSRKFALTEGIATELKRNGIGAVLGDINSLGAFDAYSLTINLNTDDSSVASLKVYYPNEKSRKLAQIIINAAVAENKGLKFSESYLDTNILRSGVDVNIVVSADLAYKLPFYSIVKNSVEEYYLK